MQEQQQRGWWGRNWKWVLPSGCLGIIVVFLVLCTGLVGLGLGMMKSSWAYSEGLNLAVHNEEVIQALGEPIEAGWLVMGEVKISGPSGQANLSAPLSGPRGQGTLYVVAHKDAGEWTFDVAEVEIAGKAERINLLADKLDKSGK